MIQISWESLPPALQVIIIVFLFFMLPGILVISIIVFSSSVAGVISGRVGAALYPRLPHVSQFINRPAETPSRTQSPRIPERRHSWVVRGVFLFYGAVFVGLYLPIAYLLTGAGDLIFESVPSLYSSLVLYLYPLYMLVLVVPVVLLIHRFSDQGSEVSLRRLALEWSIFLSVVNTTALVLAVLIFYGFIKSIDYLLSLL